MALAKVKVAVRMLVDTAYQGPRKAGDIIQVPEDFANRWVKNKIAALASKDEIPQKVEVIGQEPENETEGSGEVDYTNMKAKELYDLCVEKGIEVEAKKSKDYYIEKLNEAE